MLVKEVGLQGFDMQHKITKKKKQTNFNLISNKNSLCRFPEPKDSR